MMKINRVVIILFAAICAFVACKKGNDSAGVKQYTSVNFINTTADTVNVYVNGSRVNTTNALYPLGSSGYINALLGEQNYQVRKNGKPDVLFSTPISLDTGKIYSFFIAGNKAEDAFAEVDVDTLGSAGADTTFIRFVHTSPNAGNIDVMVGDTLTFANTSFKSMSAYFPTGVGQRRIRVYKAGVAHSSTTLLIDEIRLLTANRLYTLYTKSGLTANGPTTTTGTGIVVNR